MEHLASGKQLKPADLSARHAETKAQAAALHCQGLSCWGTPRQGQQPGDGLGILPREFISPVPSLNRLLGPSITACTQGKAVAGLGAFRQLLSQHLGSSKSVPMLACSNSRSLPCLPPLRNCQKDLQHAA